MGCMSLLSCDASVLLHFSSRSTKHHRVTIIACTFKLLCTFDCSHMNNILLAALIHTVGHTMAVITSAATIVHHSRVTRAIMPNSKPGGLVP